MINKARIEKEDKIKKKTDICNGIELENEDETNVDRWKYILLVDNNERIMIELWANNDWIMVE